MQQKRSFWKRLTGKGYYIALAVCAAAVAVSGVLFVHSLREELPDPALARSGAEDILPTPPADWQLCRQVIVENGNLVTITTMWATGSWTNRATLTYKYL